MGPFNLGYGNVGVACGASRRFFNHLKHVFLAPFPRQRARRRWTRGQTKIDHATVPAQRDPDPRTSALCVRGPYYEYNVRGYAVIPGVDIRCHAFSHQYRVGSPRCTVPPLRVELSV